MGVGRYYSRLHFQGYGDMAAMCAFRPVQSSSRRAAGLRGICTARCTRRCCICHCRHRCTRVGGSCVPQASRRVPCLIPRQVYTRSCSSAPRVRSTWPTCAPLACCNLNARALVLLAGYGALGLPTPAPHRERDNLGRGGRRWRHHSGRGARASCCSLRVRQLLLYLAARTCMSYPCARSHHSVASSFRLAVVICVPWYTSRKCH